MAKFVPSVDYKLFNSFSVRYVPVFFHTICSQLTLLLMQSGPSFLPPSGYPL